LLERTAAFLPQRPHATPCCTAPSKDAAALPKGAIDVHAEPPGKPLDGGLFPLVGLSQQPEQFGLREGLAPGKLSKQVAVPSLPRGDFVGPEDHPVGTVQPLQGFANPLPTVGSVHFGNTPHDGTAFRQMLIRAHLGGRQQCGAGQQNREGLHQSRRSSELLLLGLAA